ncbi:MAG TPA: PAS domain S-box protein [Xanthobacteraceae bacterium]|jgi:PAS domain S-box-containing protein
MPDQFSDRVRGCYEFAAEARVKADATDDPALRAEWLNAEKRWLDLACSFVFSESPEGFATANSEQRPKFDERLTADMGSAPESFLPESAEQILRSIVENNDDAIITKNLDGIISSWNKSAERVFGYTAEEITGKPVTILIPPNRPDEESTILARIKSGERIDHYETVSQRKDGSLIDISITVSPIKNAQGKIIGASKIARDITERKRNDKHLAMLAREAEHRTKNILATVQATVNLSHAATVNLFKRAIEGRIQALANVHSLFVKSQWGGAELSNIVTQELAPYLGKDEARAQIDGPNVWLATEAAQAIAMTLHELATNASKYGSLSVPEGQLCVKWVRAADGRLTLHWTESGGPPTKKPRRKGFGTSVVEQMIRQLKGEMLLDWRPEGLACEIVLQASKL